MPRVGIADSLKYGGRLFAYFLGVVVLGGGGVALGAAIGWDAASVRGTGGDPVVHDAPELVAGIGLVVIGGAILFTGLFGVIHKLLVDSIAEGVAGRSLSPAAESPAPADGDSAPPDEADQPRGTGTTAPDGIESEPEAEPTTAPAGTAEAEPASPGEPGTTATPQDRTADSAGDRERTAEEIAFGTGQRSDDATTPADAPAGDTLVEDTPPATGEDTTAGNTGDDRTAPPDDETVVPEYDEIADEEATGTSTTSDDDPLAD